MKKISIIFLFLLFASITFSQSIRKTFYFDDYKILNSGDYSFITFENCLQNAAAGNPSLPYFAVKLMLPQGTKAYNIKVTGEDLTEINQNLNLYPKQYSRPLSSTEEIEFVKNEEIYSQSAKYPENLEGKFNTQFLNGYAICLSTFSPVVYYPSDSKAAYYKKVTVEIEYTYDTKSEEICSNVKTSDDIKQKISQFVQNNEITKQYKSSKFVENQYDILIVTGTQFLTSFDELIDFYEQKGMLTEIVSISDITSLTSGIDDAEKLRNYIINEYTENSISYVLLAGDVEIVPSRGFFCSVQSSSVYVDEGIPSDIYYSALDGTWNTDNDNLWAEIGEDDLLPEIAVGRLPFSNSTDLENMLNKTLSYQQNPILGELNNPLLVDEHLWDEPDTWGSDYLDLLIGHHTDNGYETTGIPELSPYETLYERDGDWSTWDLTPLFAEINSGHPFIYHSGHANSDYVMGLSTYDITNSNFSQVNGTTHNFTFLYTHGCICGAFDYEDCIAEEMVKIDNFLAGFIGNSRYGWFNEGQTEGPSAHIQREFVDALYDQKISNIGMAHMLSKLNTAPWVNAEGQWEEGALRWCFYDCNVLADPTLALWIANPYTVTATFDDNILIGEDLDVNVKINSQNAENYNCTVFQNGIIIGKGYTDANGNTTIVLDEILSQSGEAQIIVSGYNILNTTYPFIISLETDICENLNEDKNPCFCVYPNPVKDYIVFNYENPEPSFVKIQLYDAYGKLITTILEKEISVGQYYLREGFSDIQKGVYFLKITTEDKTYGKTIIKI